MKATMTELPTGKKQKLSSEELLQEIVSKAKDFYRGLDFAHNIEHGERVAFLAKRINESEKGDPFLVNAGAWLHQFHNNLDELRQLLFVLPLSPSDAERLFEIVSNCRPHNISTDSSLEAKIVFDADALELAGPYGVIREVLCNAVARKMSWDDALQNAEEVQRLFEDKLQTHTAKALARRATQIAHDFWNEYRRWRTLDIQAE
jgi:HD superfamily phosphodiesterase